MYVCVSSHETGGNLAFGLDMMEKKKEPLRPYSLNDPQSISGCKRVTK